MPSAPTSHTRCAALSRRPAGPSPSRAERRADGRAAAPAASTAARRPAGAQGDRARLAGHRGRAVERGVAVGEHAAVGGDQPVALAGGVAAMPTTGGRAAGSPVEPWKAASPKVNTPPSPATSQ